MMCVLITSRRLNRIGPPASRVPRKRGVALAVLGPSSRGVIGNDNPILSLFLMPVDQPGRTCSP